jgi:predicted flap endonuclease-1-like 5' DNA nuclease
MLTQRPVVLSMLPLMPYTTDDLVVSELVKEAPEVSEGSLQYEYEPSAAAILDEIVPRFTELQLYHAVLESQASEHAARMVAMRNASENATALSNDLRLAYNKARQAAITAEILDIVGGAEALAETLEAQAAEMLATVQAERRATPAPAAVAVAGNSGRTKASAKAKSAPAAEPIAAETPAPTSIPKRAGKTAKAAKARSDDLKIIDGIGPKMEKALQAAGIDSYEKLSQASEDQLREAVQAAGMQLAPTLATWAKQAEFLARGDHDGLQAYQESLKKN